MDAYERFVEAEKERQMKKGGRGRLAADVEELIQRAIEYAQKNDGVKLLRRDVLEIAVREAWSGRLEKGVGKDD